MYSKNDDYWKRVKLGELSTLFSGGTPSTRVSEYWDGNIPWLSSGETRSSYITTTERKITPQGVSESSTKLAKCCDVVVASAGQGTTRGQASFCKIDTYINQSIVAIRADKTQLDPHFLYFNLKNRYQELRNISDSHSSRGSLTTKLLSNLEIPLPGIDKQKAIVRILSSLDDKIELNRQMNETLEQIAQTIFKRWFIDYEFPDENGNPYKSSGGEMVESEFGEIPKNWEVRKLKEITSNIQYGLTQSASKENIGPKFLRITDIQNGVVEWDQVPYCKVSSNDWNKYKIIDGDIFIARTGASTGENAFILDPPESVFASYLIRLQFKKKELGFYSGQFLRTSIYSEYIKNCLSGSAQPNANAQVLTDVKVALPCIEILERYTGLVEPLKRLIVNYRKQSERLSEIRDSLLPKLMSGKIRITQNVR
ncbi:MAG: restriction endonuclease subunit S [Acidobacteriota bacterium]